MTTAAAQVLQAWSGAFGSPVITDLAPGRVWQVTTEHGDRYVLKKVSTFGAPDPVRRFTDEARILTYLLQRGVPVAVPVLSDDGKAYATDGDGALHAVFPMFPQGGADDDAGLDPVLFQNIGAAIARLHIALANCPFGIESWGVADPARSQSAGGQRRTASRPPRAPSCRLASGRDGSRSSRRCPGRRSASTETCTAGTSSPTARR